MIEGRPFVTLQTSEGPIDIDTSDLCLTCDSPHRPRSNYCAVCWEKAKTGQKLLPDGRYP